MDWYLLLVGKVVVSLVGAYILILIGAYFYGLVGPFLPIRMQRPLFRMYQKRIKHLVLDNPNANPLLRFQFAIWFELVLPTIFEREGIRGCRTAIDKWFADYVERLKEISKSADIINKP